MKRTRRSKILQSSDEDSSNEDFKTVKVRKNEIEDAKPVKNKKSNDSSSESDLESYFKPVSQLDLDSPFFQTTRNSEEFGNIEKNILSDIKNLSDSSSDEEKISKSDNKSISEGNEPKINFQQLHDYTKKLEEAKKQVEDYVAKQQKQENMSNMIVKPQTGDENQDILSMLAKTEKKTSSSPKKSNKTLNTSYEMSDSEKEDWEEVKNAKYTPDKVLAKDIQITLSLPENMKKKKGQDLLAAMKRRLNRIKKENQVLIHKVHLLCWIAHGNYVNQVLNSPILLASALSLLPSENCRPKNRVDFKYLQEIVKWYPNIVNLVVDKVLPKDVPLVLFLQQQMEKKEAYESKYFVYIFICILRSLGLQCRLVLSFRVEPLRPKNSELHSLSAKETEKETVSEKKENIKKQKIVDTKSDSKLKSKASVKPPSLSSFSKTDKCKLIKVKNSESNDVNKEQKSTKKINEKVIPVTKPSVSKTPIKSANKTGEIKKKLDKQQEKKDLKMENKKIKEKVSSDKKEKLSSDRKETRSLRSKRIPQVDGADDSLSESSSSKKKAPNLKNLTQIPVKSSPKRTRKSVQSYKDPSSDSDEDFQPSPSYKLNKDVVKAAPAEMPKNSKKLSQKKTETKTISVRKNVENRNKATTNKKTQDDEHDEEFRPKSVKNVPKTKVKERIKWTKDRKVLSSDSDQENTKKGNDIWVEVFLEEEEKWISVDVIKAEVHCVKSLYSRASKPVAYVVAWNNDNSIKDVTSRYCHDFHTVTRKLRVEADWWNETLKPFKGKKTAKDKEEDEELAQMQLEKPLPKTISEYKNHPLYALQRHLLKFEAIYPPDAVPLGYIRGEAVYSRYCVYTLHSREIWLKEAKVVRQGEKPYKVVKARPKYDRLSGKMITDLPLEIFGMWQVEDYDPPTAENGKVPRNAYGNVDLFKECMLPKKCVHLRLPGLNKVAYKLKIDCAEAITGFDFHGGWSHPVIDGYVVCEEFEDTLIAAWHMEQEELERKEREKIDKRVYGNWKRLIKGLIIREKLEAKYNFGESSKASSSSPKKEKRKGKILKLISKKVKKSKSDESDND